MGIIKLSIIIPCYNSHEYIQEALDSAINQTYDDKEIIIVNDGSGKETLNFLNKINHHLVKVIHQENKGLSSARNTGISNSEGEFIMLLDADDKFESTYAEKAINIMNEFKDVGIVTCWGYNFKGSQILNKKEPKGGTNVNFLFKTGAIGTSMLRKTIWKDVGGYDESMVYGYEDWEFFIRATLICKVHVIKEYLFFYRKHNISLFSKALSKNLEIRKYIFEKHKELYISHYNEMVEYFIKREEYLQKQNESIKNKIEFRTGKAILKPFRYIRHDLFKSIF